MLIGTLAACHSEEPTAISVPVLELPDATRANSSATTASRLRTASRFASTSTILSTALNSTTVTTSTTTTLPWQGYPTGSIAAIGPNDGVAQTYDHVETSDPVVFLTIDDGRIRDQSAFDYLSERHIPVTLFLNPAYVRPDPEYFRQFLTLGGSINTHTIHHPDLRKLDYTDQQREICVGADQLKELLGSVGWLVRPPGGHWNADTQSAAGSCGLAAVVTWRVTVSRHAMNSKGGDRLQPGDIIILHFDHDLLANLQLIVAKVEAAGLHFARLEDYFRPVGAPAVS